MGLYLSGNREINMMMMMMMTVDIFDGPAPTP